MIKYIDLKKGLRIIFEQEPYVVVESRPLKKAQRRATIQTKIKNLITGDVVAKNFHQGDVFEEAELDSKMAKFLYAHRDKFVFCEAKDPSKRFELTQNQVGANASYLKANQIIELIVFNDQIINISMPIKMELKVIEAPPGIKGERSNPGTKPVTVETGAKINAPLFIGEGDVIEVNTETGEYLRRVK